VPIHPSLARSLGTSYEEPSGRVEQTREKVRSSKHWVGIERLIWVTTLRRAFRLGRRDVTNITDSLIIDYFDCTS
jgi:hypothetical protein